MHQLQFFVFMMKILTHQKNSNFSSSNQQMFDKWRQAVNIRLNSILGCCYVCVSWRFLCEHSSAWWSRVRQMSCQLAAFENPLASVIRDSYPDRYFLGLSSPYCCLIRSILFNEILTVFLFSWNAQVPWVCGNFLPLTAPQDYKFIEYCMVLVLLGLS